MSIFKNESYAMQVMDYIFEHEHEDYITWCEDNDRNPSDLKSNHMHIYAVALLSLGHDFKE